jgi:hypothetical protein
LLWMSRWIRVSFARHSPGQDQKAMSMQGPHITTGAGRKPFRIGEALQKTGLTPSGDTM